MIIITNVHNHIIFLGREYPPAGPTTTVVVVVVVVAEVTRGLHGLMKSFSPLGSLFALRTCSIIRNNNNNNHIYSTLVVYPPTRSSSLHNGKGECLRAIYVYVYGNSILPISTPPLGEKEKIALRLALTIGQ